MSDYKLRKVICLLQRLTSSSSLDWETLFLESSDLVSPELAHKLLVLCEHPHRYADDNEFLDDIIEELQMLNY